LNTPKTNKHPVTWAAAHRRPFTLATGRMRGMAPTMAFDANECARLKGVAARKVAPLAWLLRRVGGRAGKKMATQLSVGMKSFVTLNTKKYDLHLFFGASRLLALEVRRPRGWVCGGNGLVCA
jgi:hypothetical protein